MRRLLIAATLALAPLTACTTIPDVTSIGIPSAPVTVADRTTIDEQTVLSFTRTYTAVSKGAALAIRLGVASGQMTPATVRRIGELDQRFYAAAVAVERAYRAGNAANYAIALVEFNAARDALAAAF